VWAVRGLRRGLADYAAIPSYAQPSGSNQPGDFALRSVRLGEDDCPDDPKHRLSHGCTCSAVPPPTAAALRLHLKEFTPIKRSAPAIEQRRLQGLHGDAVSDTARAFGVDMDEESPPKVPSGAVRKRVVPDETLASTKA
jgi:hypothetical protein